MSSANQSLECVDTYGRYAASWKRYKKLRQLRLLFGLGWLAVVAGVVFLGQRWHLAAVFGYFVIFVWLLATSVVGTMLVTWPCPRCGKSFRGFRPYLPKACSHCGLPRWKGASGDNTAALP